MPSLTDLVKQLYTAAIDPTTSYFLPTLILGQTLPADPLAIGDHAWGDLASLSKALPSQLCAAIGPETICAPGTSATLALTQMQIVGLSNVKPSRLPAVSGTQVSAELAFGAVSNLPRGLTIPPYLAIEGTFAITLSCCPSGNGSTCSGAPEPQPITGTFATGFVGATASMTLDVDASFTVTVRALSLATAEVKFAFQTASPLISAGPINQLLQNAFNAGAQPALLQIINSRLAVAATRTALGRALTSTFQSLATQTLLGFVVSKLYLHAIDPSGSYYLPQKIKDATDPVLDPFDAGGWDMDDVGQWFAAAGTTICTSIGSTAGQLEIQTPGSKVPLTLSDITISGTSNMLPVPMLIVGDSVFGMVACNAVAKWPRTLNVNGNFTLGVSCCVTNRQRQVCTEPSQGNVGSGKFTATFVTATVAVSVAVSTSGPPDDPKLIATVEAIYFRCDPNVDNASNITFDIDITSIPGGDRNVWNNMAEAIFSSPMAVSAIVDQIRAKLNQAEVRQRLSTIMTDAIQSILAADAKLAERVYREVTMRSLT